MGFYERYLLPKIVERWQNRVNPLWKMLAGGCNINHPILTL
jgi:hypothetical protein